MPELHQRGDLLDLIQKAIDDSDTSHREFRELLAAALERIKSLNTEYDKVCESRAESNRLLKEAEEERDFLASNK